MEQNINIGLDPQPSGQTPPASDPAPAQSVQAGQSSPAYPSPVPPAQNAQVVQPVKQRRVGTFTLGIALIMIGVMVPLTMIYHENALMILRFAPAILIMLGVEVLYYAIRYKEAKLRYDGLSIFLVIMMTFVTLIASAVMPFLSNTLSFSRQERKLRNEIRLEMLDNLDSLGYAGSVNCYGSHEDYFYEVANGISEDQIEFSVSFSLDDIGVGKAPIRDQAIDAMVKVIQKTVASKYGQQIQNVSIYVNSASNQDYYDISLYRTQLDNVTKETVERRISVNPGYDTGEDDGYDGTSSEEKSPSSEELPEESQPESVPAE